MTQETKEQISLRIIVPALVLATGLFLLGYAAFSLLPALTNPATPPSAWYPADQYVPGEVLVQFTDETDETKAQQVLQERLNVPQRVWQHVTTGRITSAADPEVRQHPADWRAKTQRPTVHQTRKLLPNRSSDSASPNDHLNRVFQVRFDLAETDIFASIESLQADPTVVLAQPNFIYRPSAVRLFEGPGEVVSGGAGGGCSDPNDPFFCTSGAWGQFHRDQYGLTYSKIPEAWVNTIGSERTVIAVIDSGIDYRHPDIEDNLWVNPAEDRNHNGCPDYWDTNQQRQDCKGNLVAGDLDSADQDGNGYIDDIDGMNFAQAEGNANSLTGSTDLEGHGTLTAGIVGATTNNQVGIAAACPLCKIMPLKVGESEFDTADIISAINYARQMRASVLSMSFGSPSMDSLTNTAIQAAVGAGLVAVAATGNNNSNIVRYPAAYDNVIGVGAINTNFQRLDLAQHFGSNYGPKLDLMAPGKDILSLRADQTLTTDDSSTIVLDKYIRATGTSVAAPFVAGVVGLMRSANPGLLGEQVQDILFRTANLRGMVNTTLVHDDEFGYGLVQAHDAVIQALTLLPDLSFFGYSATRRSSGINIQAIVDRGPSAIASVPYRIKDLAGTTLKNGVVTFSSGPFTTLNVTLPPNAQLQEIELLIDPDNELPETNNNNNTHVVFIENNVAPTINPIGSVAPINEGQELRLTVAGTDPNGDVLQYTYQPTTIGGTMVPHPTNANQSQFVWVPNSNQAGTYTITFTASDGEFSSQQQATVTVNNVAPPPFYTVIPGQGFAASVPEGLMVSHGESPDWGVCAPHWWTGVFGARGRCRQGSGWYDVRGYGFRLSDVAYVRVRFNSNGAWDANPAVTATIDDNAKVRKSGSTYTFDLLPATNRDVEYGNAAYFSTLRFVEQDDQGRNYGTPGFGGWPRTWRQWNYECLEGASSGSFDKDGLGVRVWSSGTTANDILNFLTFCFFDDSGGDISPAWVVEVHLRSLNQPPVITAASAYTVGEHQNLSFTVASDANQDILNYSFSGIPEGATLDSITGVFSWTPNALQAGQYPVTVYASDGIAAPVSRTVLITVQERNQPPTFAPQPPLCANVVAPGFYQLRLTASDPNGGPLTYSAGTGDGTGPLPPGMTFGVDGTGPVLNWNTVSTSPATTVTFIVRDSFGATGAAYTFFIINSSCGSGGGGGGGGGYYDPILRKKVFDFGGG